MALNNFANLKASLAGWSKRNDVSDDDIEDYIALAENQMIYGPVPLETREMETRATATLSITSRFLELPDYFVSMRRLKINEPWTGCPDIDVEYRSPEAIYVSNQTQIPTTFTVTSQLEFNCISDDDYTIEMQYMAKMIPLSDSASTNDILTVYPNIYLFGSLWFLFLNAQEFDIAEAYKAQFFSAIEGANGKTKDGKYGPAPCIQEEGYTP